MLNFIIGRLMRMIPQIFLISVMTFIIIQLPPGDYLTTWIHNIQSSGQEVDQGRIEMYTRMYGLDQPMYVQYLRWFGNIITRFDFGRTPQRSEPVRDIIMNRIPYTFGIAIASYIFTVVMAIPIGIYAAVRQYSIGDYIFTVIGFIGLAVPGFLLAMVVMYFAYTQLGIKVGGLFSSDYVLAPWSMDKVKDFLQHVWVPIILIGIGGTANMIRTMRATMLDEMGKQYVTVARAKGLSEFQMLMRYPVRLAINPIISSTMWLLPYLFSGGFVVEIVLNLPTAGPSMYDALMGQDMHLAGGYVLIIGALTSLGAVLSDILLAVIDPRIRFGSLEAS